MKRETQQHLFGMLGYLMVLPASISDYMHSSGMLLLVQTGLALGWQSDPWFD
jgi:hypothetical protein